MPIIVASGLVLSSPSTGINSNNPWVLYENLISGSDLTANTALVERPVSNLAIPATNLYWQAAAAGEVYVTSNVPTVEPIDAVGIARHNFGSAQIAVSIEGAANTGGPFTELVQDSIPGDDSPLLFRFTPTSLAQVRVRMQAGTEAARAAVLYIGRLLVLPRRLYVGHVPITYGRKTRVTNARSESGEFLGRITLDSSLETGVEMANIDPTTFRDSIHPFFEHAIEEPFFWAWRPGAFPGEVGYCWMNADSTMRNQRTNGMVQVSFRMSGLAL